MVDESDFRQIIGVVLGLSDLDPSGGLLGTSRRESLKGGKPKWKAKVPSLRCLAIGLRGAVYSNVLVGRLRDKNRVWRFRFVRLSRACIVALGHVSPDKMNFSR